MDRPTQLSHNLLGGGKVAARRHNGSEAQKTPDDTAKPSFQLTTRKNTLSRRILRQCYLKLTLTGMPPLPFVQK